MGNNKIPSVCGKSGGFCDRFFLFPLQWGRGLSGGGINRALNSHRTYKCFPLTLTLSPHFIRRPYGSPTGEGTILYILVYRLPNIPLSALRFPLSAIRCTMPASRFPLYASRLKGFPQYSLLPCHHLYYFMIKLFQCISEIHFFILYFIQHLFKFISDLF